MSERLRYAASLQFVVVTYNYFSCDFKAPFDRCSQALGLALARGAFLFHEAPSDVSFRIFNSFLIALARLAIAKRCTEPTSTNGFDFTKRKNLSLETVRGLASIFLQSEVIHILCR